MGSVIQVGMVADRMLIEGFQAWAAGISDLCCVAEAPTVGEFLGVLRDETPDVIVLDLFLRDHSTPHTNVQRLVCTGHRVLVVSAEAEPRRVAMALLAGAHGFVSKHQDLSTLVTAIRDIATGGTSYSPVAEEPHQPQLSAREHAVLMAYCSGLTLKATASRIGISTATAKTYLERVKAKYEQVGRPAYTKLELAERVREDRLS